MYPPTKTPVFGDILPICSSPETLAFLARRRSASAVNLRAPGPDEVQIATILSLAARAPDHGKLAPWRFVVLSGTYKTTFVAGLETIARRHPDAAGLSAKLAKIRIPPITVVVISRHIPGKIPEWEQRLSAGAVCAMLIIAAQATGFGANWITDWYAYDEDALQLLGATTGEKVAGFIHIGSAVEAPMERTRPDMAALVRVWPS